LLTSVLVALLTVVAAQTPPVAAVTEHEVSMPKILIVIPSEDTDPWLAKVVYYDFLEMGWVADITTYEKYNQVGNSLGHNVFVLVSYQRAQPRIEQTLGLYIFVGGKVDAAHPVYQTLRESLRLPNLRFAFSNESTYLESTHDLFKDPNARRIEKGSYAEFGATPQLTAYVRGSGRYYLVVGEWFAWASADVATKLDLGKVLSVLYFGSTPAFGFSLGTKMGKQVFVWRVDADGGTYVSALRWISDLSALYEFKVSVAVIGGKVNADDARFWVRFAKNPLVELGVHSFHHGSYDTDIMFEVQGTYEHLSSLGIPVKKLFMGWGGSNWNETQIDQLRRSGWWMIHSTSAQPRSEDGTERLGINPRHGVWVAAMAPEPEPAIIGHSSLQDYNSVLEDRNFTEVNIASFNLSASRGLPFVLLTHEYSFNPRYGNSYGDMKTQVERFLEWVSTKDVSSIFLSELLATYHAANKGSIVTDGTHFAVKLREPLGVDVKVYVGSPSVRASGQDVLSQRYSGGWLYIGLRPATVSSFSLETGKPPSEDQHTPRTYKIWSSWASIVYTGVESLADATAYSNQRKLFEDRFGKFITIYKSSDPSSNLHVAYSNDGGISWVNVDLGAAWNHRRASGVYDSINDRIHVAFQLDGEGKGLYYGQVSLSRDQSGNIVGVSGSQVVQLASNGALPAKHRNPFITMLHYGLPAVCWGDNPASGPVAGAVKFLRVVPGADPLDANSWKNAAGNSNTPDTISSSFTDDYSVNMCVLEQRRTDNSLWAVWTLLRNTPPRTVLDALRFAKATAVGQDGFSWEPERLVDDSADITVNSQNKHSLVEDESTGNLYIVIQDDTSGFASVYRVTTSDIFEDISPAGLVSIQPTLSATDGLLYLSYVREGHVRLRMYDGKVWSPEMTYAGGGSGTRPTLQTTLGAKGRMAVLYTNGSAPPFSVVFSQIVFGTTSGEKEPQPPELEGPQTPTKSENVPFHLDGLVLSLVVALTLMVALAVYSLRHVRSKATRLKHQ